MGTLVLGLGNPILSDDGVGIHTARAVAARLQRDDVAFAEASIGGLRLLDVIAGYQRVIIVDAIQGRGRPGDVYRLHPDGLQASQHSGSPHDLSLPSALALGRKMGVMVPDDEDIVVVAVEVENVLTFGEVCTPSVAASIPLAVEAVMAELEAWERGNESRQCENL